MEKSLQLVSKQERLDTWIAATVACPFVPGIDGLASMVQEAFSLDPFTNTLFLFCGRHRARIKALYWEGDGFVLLH